MRFDISINSVDCRICYPHTFIIKYQYFIGISVITMANFIVIQYAYKDSNKYLLLNLTYWLVKIEQVQQVVTPFVVKYK